MSHNDRWNLHFLFDGTPTVATNLDAESVELTSKSHHNVPWEMQELAELN
jgi:hypothetical protein